MKVKLDIDTKTLIRILLVIVGFGLLLFVLYKIQSALVLIAIALFLALGLNPPVSRLAKTLPKVGRIGATAIAYLIVLTLLGGFVVLVIPPILEQSSRFASTVPSLIDEVSNNKGMFDDFITRYNLESTVDSAIAGAKEQASSIATSIGNSLVGGAGALLGGFASMSVILVLAFLMLIEGPTWLDRWWRLYDDERLLNRHRSLVRRMYRVVTGFVNGQMLVSSIAAVCTFVAILALSATVGIPANLAIPLAVIIFFTNLIPMVGSIIGGTIVTLVLLFNSVFAAGIFLVFFLIYQQIENNFISPVIQSRTVDLSALLVLVAIIIGGVFGGILGALIAIPVAGCLKVLWMDQLEQVQQKRVARKANPIKKLTRKKQA